VQAHERLTAEGLKTRVVSMPCWKLYEHQDGNTRRACCAVGHGARRRRAGVTFGWGRYVGPDGDMHRHEDVGASAPSKSCRPSSVHAPKNVVNVARSVLRRQQTNP